MDSSSSHHSLNVEVKTVEHGSQKGTADVSVWTRPKAMKRAAVWWASLWVLAILLLPIPIIHFVAVPACLIAGPIVGYMIFKLYNGDFEITQLNVSCPNCETPLKVENLESTSLGTGRCPTCHTAFQLKVDRTPISR